LITAISPIAGSLFETLLGAREGATVGARFRAAASRSTRSLKRHLRVALPMLFLLCAAAGEITVGGKVSGPDGQPLPGVRVEVAQTGAPPSWTDEEGRFRVEALRPPAKIAFSLEGFRPQRLTVKVAITDLDIRLRPFAVSGEITVTAQLPFHQPPPQSLASHRIDASEEGGSTLGEVAESVAGVAKSGQGGRFQVFSLRGLSRQRVKTLFAGVPLTSDRRAGVAASFVDPYLTGAVEVLRGPAGVLHGSGSLGGAVAASPRVFSGAQVEGGILSQGSEGSLLFGWGQKDSPWSLGVAHRQGEDGKAADGSVLPLAYEQTSALALGRWGAAESSDPERPSFFQGAELALYAAEATDIGKPNTDFPRRITVYPRERHALISAEARLGRGWSLGAWLHPQDLETLTTEDDGASRATVRNESLDLGLRGARRLGSWSVGVDYARRQGVDAEEVGTSAGEEGGDVTRTLQGATEGEAALFATYDTQLGPALLDVGLRLYTQRQDNAAAGAEPASAEGSAVYLGFLLPLSAGFDLVANAGTGPRFPTLSERYFSGTTGRGTVRSNPDLKTEESRSFDLGLRWHGDRGSLSAVGFVHRLEDLIERVEIEPDVLGFANLGSGTVRGLEVEGDLGLAPSLRIQLAAHWLRGRQSDGEPLADVPPPSLRLRLVGKPGRYLWQVQLAYQAAKTDPGGGEKATADAWLVGAAFEVPVGPRLALRFTGTNLLDQEYFPSADRKASLAPGRAFGLHFRWRRN
jgi:iron complex outermembrane receptor protein